ncbi:uncharacterized protein TNCV_4456261 [Trichonephila clavipes]|nr:uncharacterized protein TNCV_4456261 [Trichonephila clavipes]
MTDKMPRRGIRAHYEQLSEFERGRIIELKEAAGSLWSSLEHTYGTVVRRRHSENCFATVPLAENSGLIFQQDNARPHTVRVAMNCLTACQTLPWPARTLSNRACLGYDGKVNASNRECS